MVLSRLLAKCHCVNGVIVMRKSEYDEEEPGYGGDSLHVSGSVVKMVAIVVVFLVVVAGAVAGGVFGWRYAHSGDALAVAEREVAKNDTQETKKPANEGKSDGNTQSDTPEGEGASGDFPDVDTDLAVSLNTGNSSGYETVADGVGVPGDVSLFTPTEYDNYIMNAMFVSYGLAEEGSAVGGGRTVKVANDMAIVAYPNGYSGVFRMSTDSLVGFRSNGVVFDSGILGKIRSIPGNEDKPVATVLGCETLVLDGSSQGEMEALQ